MVLRVAVWWKTGFFPILCIGRSELFGWLYLYHLESVHERDGQAGLYGRPSEPVE